MSQETGGSAGGSGAGAPVCELCGAAVSEQDAQSINGHVSCPACVNQVMDELAAQQAGAGKMPQAILGAVVGAGVAAAIWAAIAIATDFEIGYVAVLVGFLAGKGAVTATGGGHGRPLQIVAVLGSLFGLLAAKYAIFAHYLKEYVAEEYGEQVGYFDGPVLESFTEALGEMTSPFDLLWVALAVGAAWRVPASPTLHVEGR